LSAIERYVAFWNQRESPEPLALVRMTFGLALLAEALEPLLTGKLVERYATAANGGIFTGQPRNPFSIFHYIEATRGAVSIVELVLVAASVMMILGAFTRAASIVAALAHAAFVGQLRVTLFSSDMVYWTVLFLMTLADSGAAYSVDAWRGKGSATVARWPHRLIILQLTFIYVRTGFAKSGGATWSSSTGYVALYDTLSLAGIARFKPLWAARLYPLTQFGTIVSRWFESTFFLVPVQLYLAHQNAAEGSVTRFLANPRLRWAYIAVGLTLHAMLIATTNLGFFSIVMLSLYPSLLEVEEARRILAPAERFLRGLSKRASTADV
jgi:hypothetical protein